MPCTPSWCMSDSSAIEMFDPLSRNAKVRMIPFGPDTRTGMYRYRTLRDSKQCDICTTLADSLPLGDG